MKTNPYHLSSSILFLLWLLVITTSCSENWPQFRGQNGNMVAEGQAFPLVWSSDTNVVWKTDLAAANWSSPVITGNKVILVSAILESTDSTHAAPGTAGETPSPQPEVNQQAGTGGNTPPPPPAGTSTSGQNPPAVSGQGGQPPVAAGQPGPPPPAGQGENEEYKNQVFRWEVSCYDLTTGKELWKREAFKGNPRTASHRGNGYASETPVTDGKRIWVYFGMTGLYCYDMKGNLLWNKDIGAYKTLNDWGTGSSPVAYNGIVYIKADNEENSFIIAVDGSNGNEVWRASREEKTTYSTPFIWKNSLRTELIATGKTARSYDPTTGEILWELQLGGENSISSPVAYKDFLYIGNAGGREHPGTLFCVKAGGEGNITPQDSTGISPFVAWTINDAGTSAASPLVYLGNIYLLANRGGKVFCYDAETGKALFRDGKIEGAAGFWASPWGFNGLIGCLDEKGTTHLLKAGPVLEVAGTNKLDDKFWASVAITKNTFVFRGAEKLWCIKKK